METSLLQGVLALTLGGWQRCERPDVPHYQTWVFDSRATKGEFECGDGRWVHHWVPNPAFVLGVSEGDELTVTPDINAPREDPTRIGTDPEEIVVLHHYYPLLAAAFRRFPSTDWVHAAAQVGVAMQQIRSPEEALADPLLADARAVITVDDPELGPLRQVGLAYAMSATPGAVRGPAPVVGAHTAEVLADHRSPRPPLNNSEKRQQGGPPLAGVTVVDLGLAVAGPFGTQVLADLGADVIKVNTLWDGYWHANHIAFACNRGKRSLSVDLKNPRGRAVLQRLIERADVVHHNMRYQAAERLGIDYESLRAAKPELVYCHTRGFEDGPRAAQPGNDQTGAALAGVTYEDGGCADGGRPIWSLTSLGDTGNGFLSAIAVIQALYHRDRTGEGQFVDTSILNACLLNSSYAWLRADGTPAERPHLDRDQTGLSATYRLYETAAGWLCLAAIRDEHRVALFKCLQLDAPAADDAGLTAQLRAAFATKPAVEWVELLDAHGVPAEVSSDTYALGVFDDPELIQRGWVTSYEQGLVGRLDQYGLLVDFSETPGRIAGPPLVVGTDSRAILLELGLTDDEADALIDDQVVLQAATP